MRIRPWPIVIIACICIFSPIFNVVYSAGLVHKNLIEYFTVIFEYRPAWELGLWFVLPILVGVAILAFNNWSYYLFLAFMTVVLYFTYDQWQMYPEKFSFELMLLAQVLNLVVIGYFLLPSVRMIYFTPQLRWWQQKPRFLCNVKGNIRVGSEQFACQILNISEGGVLLNTEPLLSSQDTVLINFNIANCDVQAMGKILHAGKDGYGIMFQQITSDFKSFKQTMKSLPQNGFKPRVENPPWTTSLKEWFLTFIKTGKGLIPKTEKK